MIFFRNQIYHLKMAAIPVSRLRQVLAEYSIDNIEEIISKCNSEKFSASIDGKVVVLTGPASPLWTEITDLGGKWKKSKRMWEFSPVLWKAIEQQLTENIKNKGFEFENKV